MPGIAHKDVAHAAGLARLALSDEEQLAMAKDLEGILGHVESLNAVDTEGVPPTLHGFELSAPRRPDIPAEPMDPALAVLNAPASQGTAFLVPKVLEEED